MSRKPVDKQQPTECRQAVWEWIRRNGTLPFFINDIAREIRLEESSIREYLTGLVNAGYLERSGNHRNFSASTYTLIKNTGIDAPRVRKDGTPVTQGIGRRNMWNAMQVLKSFSPVDLAFNAKTETHIIAASEAISYCNALWTAGYLVRHPDGKYSLIPAMWTGPHPPQIQRTKQVYDPNLQRVVWARVESGAE
jgi:hypothetical protein